MGYTTLDEQIEIDSLQQQVKSKAVQLWEKEVEFIESQVEIISNLVRISAEERDSQWVRIAGGATAKKRLPYESEGELDTIRLNARELADHNPYAINIIRNGKNYIYGTGHNYVVRPKDGEEETEAVKDLIKKVKEELTAFRQEYPQTEGERAYGKRLDRWWLRCLETWERRERDGEVFRRKFRRDGKLYVRFVEPEQVTPPNNGDGKNIAPFGVEYLRYEDGSEDLETPIRYYVRPLPQPGRADNLDAEPVPASEIQHIKANVDLTAPRGIPTLYAIDANLRRAGRILRNMSIVTEMQAAIAWVQRHLTATSANITAYVANTTGVKVSNPATGTEDNFRKYGPGSILHTNGGMEYEPWAIQVAVDKIVAALQAELRAIAARVQYPEFMISADASNANYSSTMVAEGPAVKSFNRLQWECVCYDLEILNEAIEVAIEAGRLPDNTFDLIEIDAEPPKCETRERLKEVEADLILVGGADGTGPKVMSLKEFAARHDLDYDKQRVTIEEEQERQVKLDAKLAPLKPPPEPLPIDPNLESKERLRAAKQAAGVTST